MPPTAPMVKLRFTGGPELLRAIRQLPDGLGRKSVVKALKEAGEPLMDGMGARAPIGPGPGPHLYRNMAISMHRSLSSLTSLGDSRWNPSDEDELAVAVGPQKMVYWGLFQEFGTVRHGPQPFAREAFEAEAPRVLGILLPSLWRLIEKQAAKTRNS